MSDSCHRYEKNLWKDYKRELMMSLHCLATVGTKYMWAHTCEQSQARTAFVLVPQLFPQRARLTGGGGRGGSRGLATGAGQRHSRLFTLSLQPSLFSLFSLFPSVYSSTACTFLCCQTMSTALTTGPGRNCVRARKRQNGFSSFHCPLWSRLGMQAAKSGWKAVTGGKAACNLL